MSKSSQYRAKQPDHRGRIAYSEEENEVWHDLMQVQQQAIRGRACDEYLAGLARLRLPQDRIPQCTEVSRVLKNTTGWQVAPVPALINFKTFFRMLNDKVFPAASFIRHRSEMDYLEEPDIFHEIFGHTPLLTHPDFSAFTHALGRIGHRAKPEYHVWLARLYWMTVEFGLVQSPQGLRVYGAGLVSSASELCYSLESTTPERKPMEVLEALRTPYRIDIHQRVYFVLKDLRQLYNIAQRDLLELIDVARSLGLYTPSFPKQSGQQTGLSA